MKTRDSLAFVLILCAQPLFAQTPILPEAQITGGWSAVAANDPGVKLAAAAMLRNLPVKHAHLRGIISAQQQVVAGMNYRLTVQLRGGSRWSGIVWSKVDGTYAVSQLVRLH